MLNQSLEMPLTRTDHLSLLERTIEMGFKGAFEAGRALRLIRDQELYKEAGHKTFEDYYSKRWHLQKSYAYENIKASEIVDSLSAIADLPKLPENVSQVKPLGRLTTEQAVDVWAEVIEYAEAENKPITAAYVAKIVQDKYPPQPKTPKQTEVETQQEEPPQVTNYDELAEARAKIVELENALIDSQRENQRLIDRLQELEEQLYGQQGEQEDTEGTEGTATQDGAASTTEAEEEGKITLTFVAEELGVTANQIKKWKNNYTRSHPGCSIAEAEQDQQDRLTKLCRERNLDHNYVIQRDDNRRISGCERVPHQEC